MQFKKVVDVHAGMDRQGRLCKLQGLVIHRQNINGVVRERLLRVSNNGPADEEVFTTSFGTNVTMGTITTAGARELCAGTHTYNDLPLVLMSRDYSNLFHTFGTQLLPLYTALVRFDLQNVRFKVVFVHDWPAVNSLRPDYESFFLDIYATVSGGVRPQTLGQLPDVVCAETALVGVEPDFLFPFSMWGRMDYTDRHRWAPPMFSGFVDWVLRAYNLQQPDPPAEDASTPGLMLIVTRTAGHSRQMLGSDALAEHARQQGWHVQAMDIGVLSMREQLELIMSASVFITVHGAAITLAAFLPVRAVVLELMPVGFGSPGSTGLNLHFYNGYANWLDAASVSHVVWHDQHGERAPGGTEADWERVCGKDSNVVLTDDAVREVFSAVETVWQTPPGARQRGKVTYLNQPQPCLREHAL